MKRIIPILAAVFLLCSLLLCPTYAEGASGSLTVCYADIAGVTVDAYYVADSSFALAGDFAAYPVTLAGIGTQAEWQTAATTLTAYVTADRLTPAETRVTDESGKAFFEDLQNGLYLFLPVQTESDGVLYRFGAFFAVVSGGEQTVNPKYETEKPEERLREFKAVKVWKDGGGENRPAEIGIELYKDGVLQSTQTLSGENNWCYAWTDADDGSVWTVVERNVPDGYTVTLETDGYTFTVVNTMEAVTPPPSTGDTAVLWPYVLAMFLAGGVLLLIAARGGRRAEV